MSSQQNDAINNPIPYQGVFLDACRAEGDIPADTFVRAAFADQDKKNELHNWLGNLKTNARLSQLPAAYLDNAFLSRSTRLPPWADEQMMKAGAVFFARHAQAIMSMLGLLSLPYCYTAANGAMVLYLSERLRNDAPRRLLETADFVWEVMAPGAFDEQGKGFSSILNVRLMHAAVRFYTLNSGKWDNSLGLPVNQEDMAGTNLSFSLIVIRGLRKFGYTISYQEQQAFMHLWNVIGWLLGIKETLLPQNGKQAQDLEKAIRTRHFRSSEHGRALTASLTDYLLTASKGSPYSGAEVLQIMRYLLEDEVADLLGIAAPKLPDNTRRLLKTINFINKLRTPRNTHAVYNKEYHKFRKSKPVPVKS